MFKCLLEFLDLRLNTGEFTHVSFCDEAKAQEWSIVQWPSLKRFH